MQAPRLPIAFFFPEILTKLVHSHLPSDPFALLKLPTKRKLMPTVEVILY